MPQTYTQVSYVQDIQVFLKKYFELFALPDDQSKEREELADTQREERDEERERLDEEEDKANEEKEDAVKKEEEIKEEESRI